MDVSRLLDGVTLDPTLRLLIDKLLEAKKATREMGTGTVPRQLANYLAQALSRYQALIGRMGEFEPSEITHRYRIAQDFYRNTVLETATG